MKLYCYLIPPIDIWRGAMDRDGLIKALLGQSNDESDRLWAGNEADWLESVSRRCFRELGWEGDVSDGPWFFAIPSDGKMEIGCAIKQGNNGDTFVSSPRPLSWLDVPSCYSRSLTFDGHGAILKP